MSSIISIQTLPLLNACLNFLSLLALLLGIFYIRERKDVGKHKQCMMSAFFFSALFLCSYLIYHYHIGHKGSPLEGLLNIVYLSFLASHIFLAGIILPFILAVFYFAFSQKWEKHKKLARIVYPIWLYVSISGILIYILIYHLF